MVDLALKRGGQQQKKSASETRPMKGHDYETDCSDLWGGTRRDLYAASTDQANQDHDDGNDQQDVDEAADGVGSHQAQQPKKNEYDSDSVEHDCVLRNFEPAMSLP
jgi:hypothetical protein